MAETPLYTLVDVWKTVDTPSGVLPILKNINFSLFPGESVALVGASGSGKTTFLNILGLFDTATRGTVCYNGVDVYGLTPKQKAVFRNVSLGFVFQFHQLLPEFNVIENVSMPALIRGLSHTESKAIALEAMEKVGISHLSKAHVLNLSGGERQRVAIARAISLAPSVLLADEPTGNLDVRTGQSITQLLKDLNKQFGMTLVVVTHNEELAASMEKRFELKDGVLYE